jgi:hypothetical protein
LMKTSSSSLICKHAKFLVFFSSISTFANKDVNLKKMAVIFFFPAFQHNQY